MVIPARIFSPFNTIERGASRPAHKATLDRSSLIHGRKKNVRMDAVAAPKIAAGRGKRPGKKGGERRKEGERARGESGNGGKNLGNTGRFRSQDI